MSKSLSKRVLTTGSDAALVYSRACVIERSYSVDIAEPSQVLERLRQQAFDLLLVCHSVPHEPAATLIASVRGERPSVLIVRLLSRSSPDETSIADRTVIVDFKPEDWIATIHELLCKDVNQPSS